MRARTIRFVATSALAVGIMAATVAPASADHHFVKIREFSFGSLATTDDGFIELQMYAPGQNLSVGHPVRVCDSDCTVDMSFTVAGTNPPGTADQSTILITEPSGVGDVVTTGFEALIAANASGGALCFVTNPATDSDCVSWGNFSADGTLPTSPGMEITGPLAADTAYRRSITGGTCATALDPADDTNNSMADFLAVMPPDPTPNSAGPQGTACLPPTPTPANPTPTTTPPAPTPAKKCKKGFVKRKGKCKKKRKK